MTMKPTDRILGPSRGGETAIIAYLASRGGHSQDVWDYLAEVYRLAPLVGMDPAILIAQSAHETANWTSPAWVNRLNPAGLGITDGPDFGHGFRNGTDAARVHVWSMLVALWKWNESDVVDVPDYAASWVDRWEDKYHDPACPQVQTIDDLNQIYGGGRATWATDKDYHTKVAAKGNAIFPGIPDQEENPMALPIPRFEKRIAPRGIPNRTGLWMNPEDVVIHEVGNLSAGANEEMHVIFVHNGGGEHEVSFHLIVGPAKVCQLFELDTACWHAGDGFNGQGNRRGIAIETIQIGDFDRTLWHLAWLCAELVVNPGRFVWNGGVPDPYLITENDFNQHANYMLKNCPQFIRDRGLWPVLMGRIDQYIALARNDQNQEPIPTPAPTPPPAPTPKAHTLPKGMSLGMARRLYERYDAPWGESFTFDLKRAAPQVWLSRGKRSIPKGGKWSDEGVNWPALTVVIREGDGDLLYKWADGSVYEAGA